MGCSYKISPQAKAIEAAFREIKKVNPSLKKEDMVSIETLKKDLENYEVTMTELNGTKYTYVWKYEPVIFEEPEPDEPPD